MTVPKTLLFILALCSQFLFAQENSVNNHSIKLNVNRLLTNELQLFYERPIGEITAMEYEVGVIYPNPVAANSSISYDGLYSGFVTGAGFRKYHYNRYYYQPSVNVRVKWLNKQTINYRNGGAENLLSSNAFVAGLRFAFGHVSKNGVLDVSGGIGFNVRNERTTVYGSNYFGGEDYIDNNPDQGPTFPYVKKESKVNPVFTLAFKIKLYGLIP